MSVVVFESEIDSWPAVCLRQTDRQQWHDCYHQWHCCVCLSAVM